MLQARYYRTNPHTLHHTNLFVPVAPIQGIIQIHSERIRQCDPKKRDATSITSLLCSTMNFDRWIHPLECSGCRSQTHPNIATLRGRGTHMVAAICNSIILLESLVGHRRFATLEPFRTASKYKALISLRSKTVTSVPLNMICHSDQTESICEQMRA